MTIFDLLWDLPTVLGGFASRMFEVLTTDIDILGLTLSLWQILATASAAILLTILVYSIVKN